MDKAQATILIADDNPDIRRLINVNLKFEGYSTLTASDGKKALETAYKHKPDLIILDVIMPEMDGWQVLANLKNNKLTKDIPVILLTGVSMKEGKERGLIEGVEDYLSKPFNPLRLLEIVEDIISTRKIVPRSEGHGERPLRIGIINEGEAGLEMIKTLSGSSTLELTAFCNRGAPSDTTRYVQNLGGVMFFNDIEDLSKCPDLDLIFDTRDEVDHEFIQKIRKQGVEILQGLSINVFTKLMEEQKISRLKERSLVKELNTRVRELSILNEMSQLLISPLDFRFLIDKIASIVARLTHVDASAVIMYDEDQEKFVTASVYGLDRSFADRLKVSLSDPIMEEITALRRPLIISQIDNWGISPLIIESLHANMKSMGVLPLFSKEKLLGVILVLSRKANTLSKEDVGLLSILAGQAGVAIENAYLYQASLNKQRLVEKLLSKLIQAQEEERKRMAAEIHDTIAQALVSIHTRVQTCISLLKKAPDKVPGQLEDLKNVVSDNVKEVRQIIFNLRPSSLDDLGLIPSLENYIKRYVKETKTRVDFQINDREKRVPPSVETAVFRIIQEALNNVKKHAEAENVIVKLNVEPKNLDLKVVDDGRGFEWESVTERFLRGDSHGIQGMKERVSLLGGNFRVSTEPGKGCIVSAQIPLARKPETPLKDSLIKGINETGGNSLLKSF